MKPDQASSFQRRCATALGDTDQKVALDAATTKYAEQRFTLFPRGSERLSITHNSCADRGAQPDIGETGQAAPHHDVPRRRIIGAREVSA